MEKKTRNILIGVGVLGTLALIWYVTRPKKQEEEVLRDAYENLEFEVGKDIILPSSFPSLNALADVLIKRPEWKLTVTGHTDNTGSEPFNQKLSLKRAEAIEKYLSVKGIDPNRINTIGKGSKQPIASNKTDAGRKKNRRVEFVIDKGVVLS